MTSKTRVRLKDLSPLERSIRSRQGGIDRMKETIERVRQRADDEIAAIRNRIAEKQTLLDALKRGALKP